MGCKSRRNIAHLVQEERPFVGQFEAANLLRDSTGESAFLMTEELALQQIEWNGSAIQLYERASAPRTDVVNRVGDQLLAGAGFSLDKNGGIRRRNLFDLFEHGFESRAVAYQLFESAVLTDLFTETESCDRRHRRPPCAPKGMLPLAS